MSPSREETVEAILDTTDGSLLDLVDNLLNKGVVVTGEVVLGLAGIDLVYVRVSALLCAADRVFEDTGRDARRPRPS
jgi:Gas vesicle protein